MYANCVSKNLQVATVAFIRQAHSIPCTMPPTYFTIVSSLYLGNQRTAMHSNRNKYK